MLHTEKQNGILNEILIFMSAKTETTENKLRRWLEHKMILIKVEGNVKTSLKIISAKSQLSKIAEN